MTVVYESSTAAESYMVLHLLMQSGLDGRVDGEYLQGGVGELPAMGQVKVIVAPEDAARARDVIEEWEKAQPPVQPATMPRSSRGLVAFLIGLVVGAGSVLMYYQTPVATDGIDYDGDGTLDEKWIFENGLLREHRSDKNRDGEWDEVTKHDRSGVVEMSRIDQNFDGSFETILEYESGNHAVTTIDLDGNGKPDRIERYVSGILAEIVIFDPATRRPRKKQVFEYGQVVTAELDSDGDGTFDTFITYDRYEEIRTKSTKAMQPSGDDGG